MKFVWLGGFGDPCEGVKDISQCMVDVSQKRGPTVPAMFQVHPHRHLLGNATWMFQGPAMEITFVVIDGQRLFHRTSSRQSHLRLTILQSMFWECQELGEPLIRECIMFGGG